MVNIAPTGNSREEDYESWYKAVCGEMQNNKRHIILISNGNMKEICVDNVASIALHNSLGFETDEYVYRNKKGNKVLIYLKLLV